MHENNVSIEEMIDQLEKAGWKRVSTTIWRSPNGGMYRGPYGAWIKQQAHDSHIQVGHASAALDRVLLHVTGWSAGEFDTYMETAERIIERLKDDAQHLKETSEAFVQTTNELMAAQAELARVKQERDGLAAALGAVKKAAFDAMCSVADEQRAGAMFANPMLAASARFALALNEIKDNPAILSAHDRAVAARVLRGLAPQINEYDGKALLHEAALYEAGEREVPNG